MRVAYFGQHRERGVLAPFHPSLSVVVPLDFGSGPFGRAKSPERNLELVRLVLRVQHRAMTRDAWLMTIASAWFAVAVSVLLYMASAEY